MFEKMQRQTIKHGVTLDQKNKHMVLDDDGEEEYSWDPDFD